jgi:hypothetical protein
VFTNPALLPGGLAPITRIGAGELRVDKAIGLNAIAWNPEDQSAALSFGQVDVPFDGIVLVKKVRVQNFSNSHRTYSVARSFRYANDAASGAVTVIAPGSVQVGPRGNADFLVTLLIKGSKLPTWVLNGGPDGGNGAILDLPEYDGYITLTSGSEKLSLPWHVLPRKASATVASPFVKTSNGGTLKLLNLGVEAGDFDVFSLTGQSPRIPRDELPAPGDNFAIVDLQSVGVRYLPKAVFGADFLEFAISTFGRRAHPNYPAEFDVYIDSNNDGTPDFVVFNAENGGFSASGQNAVFVANLATPGVPAPGTFFTDADLDSGNVIYTVRMNAGTGNVGIQPGTTFGFSVFAFDNYFTGAQTDAVEDMLFTPGNARFGVTGLPDNLPFGTVAPRSFASATVTMATVPDAKTTETGLLLMYRKNAVLESEVIRVK